MSFFSRGSGVLALLLAGCGGGVPVQVRVDDTAVHLDVAQLVEQAKHSLAATGMLPGELPQLPELWPTSLPHLKKSYTVPLPPVPVDLSLQPGDPNYEQYAQIAEYVDAIRRIEINRLVLRVDQTSLTRPLPELTLQVADKKDANPDDRRAWFTIGRLPAVEPGQVGDFDFQWAVGGESLLNRQLGDPEREFALRVLGRIDIDTEKDPRLPGGLADLRLIIVATFFVEPEKAL
jgi:hypothetical protein